MSTTLLPRNGRRVIPEDKEDELINAFVWQNKIFATYRHDGTGPGFKKGVRSRPGSFHLHNVPIPPLSKFTMGQRWMNDPNVLISYNNFQEDDNVYKYNADTNKLTLHKKSATPIDLKDCIVERIQATSKDGTKVPMTVIRAPDTKLDGTAATLLYGYGGFGNAMEQGFSTSIAQWVRAGTAFMCRPTSAAAENSARNGMTAGVRETSKTSLTISAACAEHLIKEKVHD